VDQDPKGRPPKDVNESRAAFTASSAHRRQRPARPLASRVLLWGGFVLAALVLYFQMRPSPSPPAQPTPTPTQAAVRRPIPTSTPTPGSVAAAGDWVEIVPEPTATLTPWPTLPPRVRRPPTPTPPVEQCIDAKWYAVQNAIPLNRIRVTIEVTNDCGRELGPTDVWFEVSGWREGAMVQTVNGHLMDELWPGFSEEVIIGLPGSLDWYDEVRVIVHGPGR